MRLNHSDLGAVVAFFQTTFRGFVVIIPTTLSISAHSFEQLSRFATFSHPMKMWFLFFYILFII